MALPATPSANEIRTTPRGRVAAYAVASGHYGHGNSGDEAILCVLLDQLGKLGLRRTYILTEAPDAVDRDHRASGATGLRDWELVGRAGLINLLCGRPFRKLAIQARARVFIFGGGSILRDEGMSWRNFFRLLDDIFIARLCGVPVFFYALGVGPFRTRLGRWLIVAAARCASVITVRDEQSGAALQELGIGRERFAVVTDPAFLLPPADPAAVARAAGLAGFLAQHRRTLFVYPTVEMTRRLCGRDGLPEELAAGLSRLCREDGWAVVLVPMEVLGEAEYARGCVDDVLSNRRVAAAMDPACAVHCIEVALSPPQLRALTQLATINVTVRLHAMIYAASQGIPSVALNYHPKVAGNAARFGLADRVVEFGDDWQDRMVDAVRRLELEMPAARRALSERLPALRAGAAETFRRLAALLGRAPATGGCAAVSGPDSRRLRPS